MTDQGVPRPDTSDMTAVHQVFRSSLAAAPEFVASTQGDDARRALIADYYGNLLAFLDVHHEGEEQLLFPVLRERAPVSDALVARMTQQHADVVGRLARSKDALAAWSESGDEAAGHAAAILLELGEVLTPHLDDEEAEMLPLAGEYLSMEEWGALPGHGMTHFTGDKVWLILGLIRENFTPAQREAMLEHMPPPARHMWETMGESAFQTMIAEVRQAP
jgi:hypothetical protein